LHYFNADSIHILVLRSANVLFLEISWCNTDEIRVLLACPKSRNSSAIIASLEIRQVSTRMLFGFQILDQEVAYMAGLPTKW